MQGIAEIEARLGAVWIKRQRAPRRLRALFEPAEFSQRRRASVVQVRVARFALQARLERLQRLREAPQAEHQLALVGPYDRHVRFELERPVVEAQRGLQFSRALDQIGAEGERLRKIRFQAQRLVEPRRRPRRIAGAKQSLRFPVKRDRSIDRYGRACRQLRSPCPPGAEPARRNCRGAVGKRRPVRHASTLPRQQENVHGSCCCSRVPARHPFSGPRRELLLNKRRS